MVARLAACLIGLAAALALAAGAAVAGQPVSLRQQVPAAGDITLGDLFDNTGSADLAVVAFGKGRRQAAYRALAHSGTWSSGCNILLHMAL